MGELLRFLEIEWFTTATSHQQDKTQIDQLSDSEESDKTNNKNWLEECFVMHIFLIPLQFIISATTGFSFCFFHHYQ